MDDVSYLNLSFNFPKMVLMMPEAVRTESLLIGKKMWFVNMCDFSDPVDGYTQNWADTICDYHASVHLITWLRCYPQSERRRCNFVKIARI